MNSKINWSAVKDYTFTKGNLWVILGIGIFPPVFGTLQFLSGIGNDEHTSLHWTAFDGFLNVIYSYIVTSVMVLGASAIIAILNQLIPWKGNITKRIFVEAFLVILLATAFQSLLLYLLEGTRMIYIRRELTFQDYWQNIIFTNTVTIIATAIFEGAFFFRNWRDSLIATERLQKEQAMSQVASLRSQMDPHFLFNSLNVLSGLIKQDPNRAEAFVNDFAKVYRYLLEVKDEMVVPLRKELAFAEQYLHLQQTRFQEGLEVSIQLEPSSLDKYLPPLSLQEAISNAIKHNSLTKEYPLKIDLKADEQKISICNNFQLRSQKADSTGTGLQNIKERYRLLEANAPRFERHGEIFLVELPLLSLEE